MAKYGSDGAIILYMIRVIVREVVILIFSVSIFPITLSLLLMNGNIDQRVLTLIYREITNFGNHSFEATFSLLARLFTPYLAIQAFRAYQWSRKGGTPKKWSYLYFSVLAGSIGAWFASKSLDLFHFMFELGDIPGELGQFVRLEFVHILWASGAFYLCVRFFLIAFRG